ncbi:MAG: hypothetical protein GWP08_20750, partial [Nitrospiraceae bacterium]|nr:hypothetical protein [Nitrospiraceae bacterium]
MKTGKQWLGLWVTLCLVGLLSTSCSIFGGRVSRTVSAGQEASDATPAATPQDHEAQLSALANKMVASANKNADDRKHRVQKRNPYFYKEYGIYPDGTDNMEIVVQEQEGVRTPYVAD